MPARRPPTWYNSTVKPLPQRYQHTNDADSQQQKNSDLKQKNYKFVLIVLYRLLESMSRTKSVFFMTTSEALQSKPEPPILSQMHLP